MPGSGRSANSHRAERSMIDRLSAASPTTIRISGPLTRMLTAIAVQKAASAPKPTPLSPSRCGAR